MPPNRREFLKSAAVAGAVLGLPVPPRRRAGARAAARPLTASRPSRAKRLLILGGTGFIGPHMVEYALSRGHTVTLFNRGRTNTDLFPTVEKLVGDRNGDLEALKGREWDVVLDNHATLPRWVRQSAQLLKDAAEQYVFVSSISVFAPASFETADGGIAEPGSEEEDRLRLDEESPLMQLSAEHRGEEITGETYGPFKAMSEEEARRAFPGRATIVRPGLIVGPRDPTDRFTYWPVRIHRGGEVLAPGDGSDSVQIIDARDLTAWVIRLAEDGVAGTFNAVGPASRLSMAEMLYGVRAITPEPVRFTWANTAFLAEQGVRPWQDLPVWLPADPLSYVRIDRALEAGLAFRPLAQTARDTLAWHRTRPPARQARLRFGLTGEREAEVLAAWHARGA